MATKTTDIHIRINPTLKKQAEEYFEGAGVTMSQALEQFLAWTVKHQKTPIRLKRRANIPDENLMTKEEIVKMLDETMDEIKAGKCMTFEQFKERVEELHGIKLRV